MLKTYDLILSGESLGQRGTSWKLVSTKWTLTAALESRLWSQRTRLRWVTEYWIDKDSSIFILAKYYSWAKTLSGWDWWVLLQCLRLCCQGLHQLPVSWQYRPSKGIWQSSFLAVQDSSIGDLVTHWLSESGHFWFQRLQSTTELL